MSLVVERNDKQFELPEEGLYQAVVADVVDLGEVDTMYGKKHKVRFVYLLAESDSEGRRFRIFQQATASLHEKSTMYRIVKRLSGNKEPDDTFDLETLIGKQCQLDIAHNEHDGKTYANAVSILTPVKGQKVEIPDDFVPAASKEKTETKKAAPKSAPAKQPAGVNVKPQTAVVPDDGDTINL